VNRTLLLGFWRQRLASPIRVVILSLIVLTPPALGFVIKGLPISSLGDVIPLVMVLAVGMIGQDISSGVLQLILARPVRRSEYVLSRWVSVAIGASVLSLLQIGLFWALTLARGSGPSLDALATLAVDRELQIFGVAATMALLSSLIGGVGDLAVYALLTIFGGIVGMIGQMRQSEVVVWVGHEIGSLVSAKIEVAQIVAGSPSWFALATYASNLTLCLLLAILILNKKELSYASG
jgi:ABC-type transport system involved in multi-copper enzyme maturation permease subunit